MEKEEIKQLVNVLSGVFRAIHQRSFLNLEAMKLYPGQPKFLALIKSNEGVTQKELAKIHCVKPATITGMLGKLEANHFVYRVPDETDKRIMRVYLTPEGRHIAEQSEKFMISLTEKMFEDFTKEEIQSYLRLTQKIITNIEKEK
jgi:DNA-binding MarR family transcriptional regulator